LNFICNPEAQKSPERRLKTRNVAGIVAHSLKDLIRPPLHNISCDSSVEAVIRVGYPWVWVFSLFWLFYSICSPQKKIKAWEYVRQETLDDRQKILNQQALVAGFS
jgi:hypothetical protein